MPKLGVIANLSVRRPIVFDRLADERRRAGGAAAAFTPAALPGLIGFWRMAEPSGSVSLDSSPEGNNGAYTGVTLGAAGIGDGHTAASFDGTTSFNNIYSAGLAADFTPSEFTLALWAKVSGAGVWTDGVSRRLAILTADASNRVFFTKSATNNTLSFNYLAGATNTNLSVTLSDTAYVHVALTVSKAADAAILYVNGVQSGVTQTGLGVWVGALASTLCCLGAGSTVPVNIYSGFLANGLLYNRALTATEIASLSLVATYA